MAQLEQRMLDVLSRHPQAWLNAVDEQGLFVPLPAALCALGHPQQLGLSGAELVDPDDLTAVLAAWTATLSSGTASVDVREDGTPTRLHLFDLRQQHGVLVAVSHPRGPALGAVAAAGSTDGRPRLGRTRKDASARLLEVDDAAEVLLGGTRETLLGSSTIELVHPEDRRTAVTSWFELLARPGSTMRTRLRHRQADGGWLWLDVLNHNRLADRELGCIVSDLIDVSQEMAFREDVKARERLLQRLTQALPVGVAQLDPEGCVQYANARLLQILGAPRGRTLQEQFTSLVPESLAAVTAAFRTSLRTAADLDLDVVVEAPGGRRRGQVALRPLVDDEGGCEGVLVCLSDVTESTRLREELEHRATYDVLTGCLTRAALLQRLETAVRAVEPGRGCAVVFLDLDGFKAVNDTRGHDAGDALLRQVGSGLRAAVRATDDVGRLGGDEFVVVCRDVPDAAAALELARVLSAAVVHTRCRASAGVSWSADPATGADVLLSRADAAMYVAKRDPRTEPVPWTRTCRPAAGPARSRS